MKLLHPTEPPKPFRCDECQLDFFNSEELCEHDIKRHVPKSAWPHSCGKCKTAFVTPGELECHRAREEQLRINVTVKKKMYPCMTCSMGYIHPYFLEYHKFIDHQGNSFKCKTCKLLFRSFSEFELHTKTCIPKIPTMHREPRVKCERCGTSYDSFKSFLAHQEKYCRLKYPEINPICDICSWTFPSADQLIQHKRKHNKNQCKNCYGIFSNFHILQRHKIQDCHEKALELENETENIDLIDEEVMLKRLRDEQTKKFGKTYSVKKIRLEEADNKLIVPKSAKVAR